MARPQGRDRDAPYLDALRDQLGVAKGALLRPTDDAERLLDAVDWSRRKYGYGKHLKALGAEIKQLRRP